MQYGFYSMLCRFTMSCCWKGIYQEHMKGWNVSFWKHHCERLFLFLFVIILIVIFMSLFLLAGGAGIFSTTNILSISCRFLYSLIKCLQINWIFNTSFWFHSKLVLEKTKKHSNELARYISFFWIFYLTFF